MMKYFLPLFIFIFSFGAIAAQQGPVAVDDTVTLPENSHIIIPVTANDVDTSASLAGISVLFPALHGTTAIVNVYKVLYTPVLFYFGPDSFTYQVCDTLNLCATASVYITVRGSDFAPIAGNDNYSFSDTVNSVVLNVLANDVDPGGDTLYVSAVLPGDSGNTLGQLSIDSAGQVVFTRVPLSCGSGNFHYVVCNYGKCDTGLISILVICPDSVFLPQGFSPNGDGKNDMLVFTGLPYFAPASLQVFNRYGVIVYQNTNYQNDWDGTDNDTRQPLPDGAYFYILQLSNKRTYNSYLVINR